LHGRNRRVALAGSAFARNAGSKSSAAATHAQGFVVNRLTLRLTLLGLPFAVLFAIGYGLMKAAGWI
jgi:hypothetical protein